MDAPPALDPRSRGLGALSVLPDEVLDYLLRGLDAKTLVLLGCASRVLRIYCCEEPLWLELHLARCKQPFEYRGSWRATYLACNPHCQMPACTAAALRPLPQVEGFSSMFLYRRWYRGHVSLSNFVPGDPEGIPRVDGSTLAPAEFEARYDQAQQPVLLQNLTAGWEVGQWDPQRLASSLGCRLFKATKPSGGRIKMALCAYLQYAAVQCDEEPVYIFDASFGEAAPELLRFYSVPHLFAHDLFGALGYARDEYRWLVLGPPRSGASWHVDPAATSAWNTSLVGRKRWALYPPGKVPPGVSVYVDGSGEPDFKSPTSLQWFLEVYPQLPPEQRPLEVVQQPGETIFLPAGWWHCVLNLDLTVAVTQNFVSLANLERVVQYLSLGAGSLFDEALVPAYLEMRKGKGVEEEEEEAGKQQQQQQQGEANGKPPSATALPASSGGRSPSSSSSGNSSSSSDDDDREAVSATEHLKHAVLGFQRGGTLGRWLRQLRLDARHPSVSAAGGAGPAAAEGGSGSGELCCQVPAASLLDELAERYTDVAVWRRRVEAVCEAAGVAPPLPHESFPLSGGECMVFKVGGTVLKVFNPSLNPATLGMWQVEVAAYRSLAAAAQQQRRQQQQQHGKAGTAANGTAEGCVGICSPAPPCLLLAGVLRASCGMEAPLAGECCGGTAANGSTAESLDTAAAAAAAAAGPGTPPPSQRCCTDTEGVGGVVAAGGLPFLLVTESPGVTLGSCMETLSRQQWQALGAAVGEALAEFHALPLPRAVPAATDNPGNPAAATVPSRRGSCAGDTGSCTCAAAAAAAGGQGAAVGAVPAAVCTAWVGHTGRAWSSLHGEVGRKELAQAVGEGGSRHKGSRGGEPPSPEASPRPANGTGAEAMQQQREREREQGGQQAAHQTKQQVLAGPEPGQQLLPPRLTLFPGVPLGEVIPARPSVPNGTESLAAVCQLEEQPPAKRARREVPAVATPAAQAAAAAAAATEQPAAAAPATEQPAAAAAALWGPFLSFLRRRRQRVVQSFEQSGALPPHLVQQLESYLPQDPAVLLGLPATFDTGCGAGGPAAIGPWPAQGLPQPSWVHGDLTAENLLLQPQLLLLAGEEHKGQLDGSKGSQAERGGTGGSGSSGSGSCKGGWGGSGAGSKQVLLIDFADGGQGDPLWDLVPLYLRSFRCNPEPLRQCLVAYQQHQQQRRQQADAAAGAAAGKSGSSLLSAAMLSMLSPRAAFNATGPPFPAAAGAAAGVKTSGSSIDGQQQEQWEQREPKLMPLSYVATCYSLLHELDVIEAAIKRRPGLWEAASLQQLQQELWGVLDEVAAADGS